MTQRERQQKADRLFAKLQTDAREAAIGHCMVRRAVKEMGGVWQNPEQQSRVDRISRQIVNRVKRRAFDYTFILIDAPDVNAGALMGGYILVTRGLLAVFNDAELAGVLAHEVAHVEASHGRKQMQRELKTQRLLEDLGDRDDAYVDDQVAEFMYKIWQAGQSREEEEEADLKAFDSLLRTGSDPLGLISGLWKAACGPMADMPLAEDSPPESPGASGVAYYVYVPPRGLVREEPEFSEERMERLLADHPPIEQRIGTLSACLRLTGRYVPETGPFMPDDDPNPREVDPGLFDRSLRPSGGPDSAGIKLCLPWGTVARPTGGQPVAKSRKGWLVPKHETGFVGKPLFEVFLAKNLPGYVVIP